MCKVLTNLVPHDQVTGRLMLFLESLSLPLLEKTKGSFCTCAKQLSGLKSWT